MEQPNPYNNLKNKFYRWFNGKDHPRSVLNKKVFFYDSLILIGLIIVFLIVYSNSEKLNQIVLVFIKMGSLILLILLFFIIRKILQLITNSRYGYRGLNNGIKAIIAIVILLIILLVYLNQAKVIDMTLNKYNAIEFKKFNPLDINLDTISLPNNNNLGNSQKSPNTVTLIPSQMSEYDVYAQFLSSCAYLETTAQSQGQTNAERQVCTQSCGKRNMNYKSYSCDRDKLVCYCNP